MYWGGCDVLNILNDYDGAGAYREHNISSGELRRIVFIAGYQKGSLKYINLERAVRKW